VYQRGVPYYSYKSTLGISNPGDFKPWGFSAFRDLKILLESLHILGEGDPALVGDST